MTRSAKTLLPPRGRSAVHRAARRMAVLPPLLVLIACAAPSPRPAADVSPAPSQGVRGRLSYRSEPLAGAVVYAYRRGSAGFFGPADFASAPSGRDGSYLLDLVEGNYWLVARKRASGRDGGPLAPGDLQGVDPRNPVVVAPGRFTVADLDLDEMRELRPTGAVRGPTTTGVRGRILDEAGRPVSRVFAIAYASSDMRRMPDFTSAMTADDGRYVIYLPHGGTFWVGARTHIRARPTEGEPFGFYAGSPDHSLVVADGTFAEGVDIILTGFRRRTAE